VLSAYQAVAIDEHRWPFRPALMELKEEHKARIRASQKGGEISPYEQKWFPGAHSNVGGGYPDSQLADCTLKWMIEKAIHHGLKVDLDRISVPPYQPKASAEPGNSQTLFYRFATIASVWLPRPILRLVSKQDAPLLNGVKPNGTARDPRTGEHSRSRKPISKCQGLPGSISLWAIEKLATDKTYRPPNINVDFGDRPKGIWPKLAQPTPGQA
jgi:hypothetical protein